MKYLFSLISRAFVFICSSFFVFLVAWHDIDYSRARVKVVSYAARASKVCVDDEG